MDEQKPADWDWVTERKKCSASVLFDELQDAAQKNVDTRNAHDPNWTKYKRFALNEPNAGVKKFIVAETFGDVNKPYVTFRLRDETIIVQRSWEREDTVYQVTLQDDGTCRLKDAKGAAAVDAWQVLRDMLEHLFFRSVD